MTAAGDVGTVLTTENVSAAFKHPISVQCQDGRRAARAVRRASLV